MNVWTHKLGYVLHYKMFGVPFYVVLFSGILGILVDIDHPISYWVTGETSRVAHSYIMYISCLVIIAVYTYIAGLYFKYILGGNN